MNDQSTNAENGSGRLGAAPLLDGARVFRYEDIFSHSLLQPRFMYQGEGLSAGVRRFSWQERHALRRMFFGFGDGPDRQPLRPNASLLLRFAGQKCRVAVRACRLALRAQFSRISLRCLLPYKRVIGNASPSNDPSSPTGASPVRERKGNEE